MKHFFTVFVIFALIGSLGAADKADTKKKNAIAGVYVGLVEDEQARLIIKSDGSLTIFPSKDREVVLRGKWKLENDLKSRFGSEGSEIIIIFGTSDLQ